MLVPLITRLLESLLLQDNFDTFLTYAELASALEIERGYFVLRFHEFVLCHS